MQKQFENFQKMKIKDACKAIEDMTFTFINPTTQEPTYVPAKHYENILSKTVEQFIDDKTKMEMLNTVYKQLTFLKEEYGKDFIKSLICMDMGIKPLDMSLIETIALEHTYSVVNDEKTEQKKNFHLLDKDFINEYKLALNDRELQRDYMQVNEECEPDIEDDFDL